MYFIKNRNLRFQNNSCRTYNKYKKKYNSIIEGGITSSEEPRKSDKVWICWFQGEENAPKLVKACIESIRRTMPEKDIVVLTENNIDNFACFPDYIVKKRKEGRISAAHYSDLLRVELLCRYGGIWIDSTVLCTSESIPLYVENSDFFLFKKLDLINLDDDPIICSSWFTSSVSNNKILLLTRKLLWYYWKKNSFLEDYFLFHIFLALSARRYKEIWNVIPLYNNQSPHELFLQLEDKFDENNWHRIISKSDFHKLSHHIDYSSNEGTIYNHIIEFYTER